MTNTGAIVAAIKLRKERHLVALLRERNALSAVNAIEIDKQSGLANAAFRSLIRNGAVIQSQPGWYWLDEAAYTKMRATRTMLMSVVIVAAIAIVAAVIYLSSRGA
jgi:hypothetical protein